MTRASMPAVKQLLSLLLIPTLVTMPTTRKQKQRVINELNFMQSPTQTQQQQQDQTNNASGRTSVSQKGVDGLDVGEGLLLVHRVHGRGQVPELSAAILAAGQ